MSDAPASMRVLIASDRPLLRRALAESLESRGIRVVGQSGEERAIIALARELEPDVVVVDLETGATWLPAAIDEMREVSSRTRVVIVTRFDSLAQARSMLQYGAHAYLGRGATIEELLLVIRSVHDPRREEITMTVVSKRAARLTDREVEVLVWAVRGLTNAQIASRLYVSEATVRRHMANAYEKMGVHSRREATFRGLEEGWVTIRDVLWEGEEVENRGPRKVT